MSYKNKFYILSLVIVIFSFLAYSLAFGKTILIKNEYSLLLEKISESEIDESVLINKRKKLEKLENIIGNDFEGNNFHEQMLQIISNYCSKFNIKVIEYPAVHEFQNKDYMLQTSTITLESDYLTLLKLIYYLESSNKIGRIISVNFYKERNNRTRKDNLMLKFYIQNIKKNEIIP